MRQQGDQLFAQREVQLSLDTRSRLQVLVSRIAVLLARPRAGTGTPSDCHRRLFSGRIGHAADDYYFLGVAARGAAAGGGPTSATPAACTIARPRACQMTCPLVWCHAGGWWCPGSRAQRARSSGRSGAVSSCSVGTPRAAAGGWSPSCPGRCVEHRPRADRSRVHPANRAAVGEWGCWSEGAQRRGRLRVSTAVDGRAGCELMARTPPGPVAPMLASAGEPPSGAAWAFEFKWDGVLNLTELLGQCRGVGCS